MTLNSDQLLRMPTPTRNALNAVAFLPGVNTTGTNRDSTLNSLPEMRAYAQAGRLAEALASLEHALRVANETGQQERARELSETIRQTRAAIERRPSR